MKTVSRIELTSARTGRGDSPGRRRLPCLGAIIARGAFPDQRDALSDGTGTSIRARRVSPREDDPLRSAALAGPSLPGPAPGVFLPLRIFIDATTAKPETRVFGLSLLSRLLHSLRRSPLAVDEIRVVVRSESRSVEPDHPTRRAVSRRAPGGLPVTWEGSKEGFGGPLADALRAAPESSWLVLSAETIVDARLLTQMAAFSGNVFFSSGDGEERGVLLRLEAGARLARPPSGDLSSWVEALASAGEARPMRRDEFDGYIVNLRRDLEPYLFTVKSDAARQRIERFLFWSNYKGSTDFMTKYVWPPLVWALVRPLARWGVHPNWVTGVSIAATLGAIPLWSAGWWGTGFFLAYLMSLLDSVDGKLARLTYTYSRLGNVLDHGLDLVHPPFWYLAWAWGLSSGDPQSSVFQASLWMFGFYVADRLCAPIFKRRTGRSIHGYLPIDVQIRTFISRRNVNLPFFTAAVAIDALRPGTGWELSTGVFYAIVAWQAVCVVYHAVRTVQFFNVEKGSSPV
jgi:phosphatidylglycerophosphate synthase